MVVGLCGNSVGFGIGCVMFVVVLFVSGVMGGVGVCLGVCVDGLLSGIVMCWLLCLNMILFGLIDMMVVFFFSCVFLK